MTAAYTRRRLTTGVLVLFLSQSSVNTEGSSNQQNRCGYVTRKRRDEMGNAGLQGDRCGERCGQKPLVGGGQDARVRRRVTGDDLPALCGFPRVGERRDARIWCCV